MLDFNRPRIYTDCLVFLKYVWVMDYSDVINPKMVKQPVEREVHLTFENMDREESPLRTPDGSTERAFLSPTLYEWTECERALGPILFESQFEIIEKQWPVVRKPYDGLSDFSLASSEGRVKFYGDDPNRPRMYIEPRKEDLLLLREACLHAAQSDTAHDPKAYEKLKEVCPLAGHCLAVALIVREKYSGDIVYTTIGNGRHCWNKLPSGWEIDLTSSQFHGDGLNPIAKLPTKIYKASGNNPRFKKFRQRVRKANPRLFPQIERGDTQKIAC